MMSRSIGVRLTHPFTDYNIADVQTPKFEQMALTVSATIAVVALMAVAATHRAWNVEVEDSYKSFGLKTDLPFIKR